MQQTPSEANAADTALVLGSVLAPTLAVGVIKRRPSMLGLADRFDVDRTGVRLLARLRRRYGPGLLRLRVPGRSLALVLDETDVGRMLTEGPEPFSPANLEKRGALGHFQPHGVLISPARQRPRRRGFNERVLDTPHESHVDAPWFATVVREEVAELQRLVDRVGELDWETFNHAWWRIVRRVMFGDTARDDAVLTALLDRLRLDANWAYLRPGRLDTLRRFLRRLDAHVTAAESGSLAAHMVSQRAELDAAEHGDLAEQAAHWLFAFDAAGMTVARALAVLAGHPAHAAEAVGEARGGEATLPYLRACVLDTNRLWPTTPLLLRETTTDVPWGGQTLAAGTGLLIYTPYFHRRPELENADSFDPRQWLDGRAQRNPGLVPFSDGPAACPGRNLVLLLGSTMLAALLEGHEYTNVAGPRLRAGEPLPATVDNFGMRWAATRR